MKTDKVDVESVRVVDPPMLPEHTNGARATVVVPVRRVSPDAARARKSYWWVWLLVFIALGIGCYFAYPAVMGMLKGNTAVAAGGKGKGGRGAPVVVATARKGDLPIYLDEIGTVTALNTVTVHTRVDGQLDNVPFVEGQMVKAGDLIAEIDPRPFQVQLTQAQGTLARDEALRDNAKADLQRYQEAKEAVSRQQLDTAAATLAQAEGNVKTDQGAIDSANLNLVYCKVTSPISGKIGLRTVDAGNIVHASDATGLAVITQLQPISVMFSVAQDDVPQIIEKMQAGQKLVVEAYDRSLVTKLATGELSAADSEIDQTTSKLRFKSTFSNENNALFPNQFVNVRLLIDTKKDVVIVPTAAVQISPDSKFVYVVKKTEDAPATAPAEGEQQPKAEAEETGTAKGGGRGGAGATSRPAAPQGVVEMRTVTLGEQQGDQTVIAEGVEAGEVVVTDGVDKLQDGAKVTIGRNEAGTRPAGTTTPAADDDAHTGAAATRTGEMTQGAGKGHRRKKAAE